MTIWPACRWPFGHRTSAVPLGHRMEAWVRASTTRQVGSARPWEGNGHMSPIDASTMLFFVISRGRRLVLLFQLQTVSFKSKTYFEILEFLEEVVTETFVTFLFRKIRQFPFIKIRRLYRWFLLCLHFAQYISGGQRNFSMCYVNTTVVR